MKDTCGCRLVRAMHQILESFHRLVALQRTATVVRLLRDAGVYPFVKANVPITPLSFESFSDVRGTLTRLSILLESPLHLVLGGSRLGIDTDVAGSVRIPRSLRRDLYNQSIYASLPQGSGNVIPWSNRGHRPCLFSHDEDTRRLGDVLGGCDPRADGAEGAVGDGT
ncbi:hypothetical protein BC826DRAFT_1119613 [Russula brevipes]|nr:hypothetical protein BC826DRAFT_1119613 [Russula brevipes]